MSFVIGLLLMWVPASATILASGTSEAVRQENSPQLIEMYRIRMPNVASGTIEVSEDQGISWKTIGKVIYPTAQVSNQGYTASRWLPEGKIAAVSVNAIHIKTDYNFLDDRGVLFSIMPKEFLTSPKNYNSYLSPDSSIYTDLRAGESIFGGDYTPFTGNQVSTVDAEGNLYPLTLGYVPKVGDTFLIQVERPKRCPSQVIFENRFGGLITLKYPDGEEKVIGQVFRPVEGVGRFSGSQFASVGRIRANHTAVICISTSPLGKISGFQIIPANHGMSKEMSSARFLTQWMVVGPVSALDPSFEGVAPLFLYYIQPRYGEDDIDKDDWQTRLLRRFLVEVKVKDDENWQVMPSFSLGPDLDRPLAPWAGKALQDITHIRIMFPIYE